MEGVETKKRRGMKGKILCFCSEMGIVSGATDPSVLLKRKYKSPSTNEIATVTAYDTELGWYVVTYNHGANQTVELLTPSEVVDGVNELIIISHVQKEQC